MKQILLLCLLLLAGSWQTQAQSAAQQAYDRESILLEPSTGRFYKGNMRGMRAGIYGQRMLPHIQGADALKTMEESVKRSKRGFWLNVGGLGLILVAPVAPMPLAAGLFVGALVVEIIAINDVMIAGDELNRAVWLHNRSILDAAPTAAP